MNQPSLLTGIVAAAHTPFKTDGNINPDIIELQAKHLAGQKVTKVFITGSTGESSSLRLDEKLELFDAWKQAGDKYGLSIIAHVGGTCLEDGIILGARAEELGFSAISALAPSYYRPGSVQTLVNCCAELATGAPNTPFYYYDIPVLTNVRFSMVEFMRLAETQIPTFAGIKFTNPDLGHYLESLNYAKGKYDLPWGVDEWTLGALATGAKGGVGSTFNFAPALYYKLIDAFQQGDMETARDCQTKSIQMINILASRGYMGCAKALMGWLGVPLGGARLPLENPNSDTLKEVRAELEKIGYFDWSLI